jgi:hypothetical protein
MKASVLSQLAALKGAPAPVLKAKWRELFETEPPAYNRRFLESRLAYRIQELAYGGLSRETLGRLRAMAKQYATRDAAERKARPVHRPIAGTKLIREYQGIEHCVTVRADDFEYLGRPYKSLSSIAREITGTKWNGLVFFGLKRHPVRRFQLTLIEEEGLATSQRHQVLLPVSYFHVVYTLPSQLRDVARLFRGKFLTMIMDAHADGQLKFFNTHAVSVPRARNSRPWS